jgi:hypothetical protein
MLGAKTPLFALRRTKTVHSCTVRARHLGSLSGRQSVLSQGDDGPLVSNSDLNSLTGLADTCDVIEQLFDWA